MDSDDEEMLAEIIAEEAEQAGNADDDEHLLLLGALADLLVQNSKPRRGGSAPGRRKAKARQHIEGYCILYADYFTNNPIQGEAVFRRRFWMNWKLFLKIVHKLRAFDDYFICKRDCTGLAGG